METTCICRNGSASEKSLEANKWVILQGFMKIACIVTLAGIKLQVFSILILRGISWSSAGGQGGISSQRILLFWDVSHGRFTSSRVPGISHWEKKKKERSPCPDLLAAHLGAQAAPAVAQAAPSDVVRVPGGPGRAGPAPLLLGSAVTHPPRRALPERPAPPAATANQRSLICMRARGPLG